MAAAYRVAKAVVEKNPASEGWRDYPLPGSGGEPEGGASASDGSSARRSPVKATPAKKKSEASPPTKKHEREAG